jgi:hypothetical protein
MFHAEIKSPYLSRSAHIKSKKNQDNHRTPKKYTGHGKHGQKAETEERFRQVREQLTTNSKRGTGDYDLVIFLQLQRNQQSYILWLF